MDWALGERDRITPDAAGAVGINEQTLVIILTAADGSTSEGSPRAGFDRVLRWRNRPPPRRGGF
jgi:hypothetical protein